MIKEKEVNINIVSRNMKYYINLGYNCKVGDTVLINVNDIQKGSHMIITAVCDNCKKENNISIQKYNKNYNNQKIYTCKKCSYIKNKKTNIKKYGVDHPLKNKDIYNKLIQTNLNKYGVKNVFQSNEVKCKIKISNNINLGVDYPQQNKKILQKSNKTNQIRYGVDRPAQNLLIQEKCKNTKNKKYGNEFYNNINKIKLTIFNKYGIDNISLLPNHKEKIQKINKEKLYLKYPYIKNINYEKYIYECECEKNHNYKIDIGLFHNRLSHNINTCTVCYPKNSIFSNKEIELLIFIKENYSGKIEMNDRKILNGKELDIYIPELKIAFEFNGVYWHNELYKDKNYHLNKTEECEKQGIQLIHIWEDNWRYKQDIIKSMILNKLGKISNKIFGRKTKVKEVTDNKLIREFLIKNHLQGFIGSKVKLGLFLDNELVSLMTFGKRRVVMGKKSTNEGEYELLRFCNKLNANIIGGASKLFRYFIQNYQPKEITTYADISHSNGNLYEKLGFKLQGKTQPNYYYVIDGIRKHRFNFRKDVLIKEGYDSNKTEHQIMIDRNIFRIYDSGNLKYNLIL